MMLDTSTGMQIDSKFISRYFESLIDAFFKILPMKEDGEETLPEYLRGLQIQMLGCEQLVESIENNSRYVTLLSILQYFLDNPDCEVAEVKRQVFAAIRICKILARMYSGGEHDR